MNPGAIVVEFVGLPGAGKTTLSRAVARLLEGEGGPVREPMLEVSGSSRRAVRAVRKLAIVLREIARSPVSAMAACRTIARTRQRSFLEALSQWFNWELVTGLLRRGRRRGGVQMFDQGPWQALWSIRFGAARGTAEALARALLHPVLVPDLVVVVESDLAAIEGRLLDRTGADSRIEREKLQIRSQWSRLAFLLEENLGVIRLRASSGACALEFVDNGAGASVDRNARRLLETSGGRLLTMWNDTRGLGMSGGGRS